MTEHNDQAREVLLDTIVSKLDQQDEKDELHEKRISAVETRLLENAKLSSDINVIKADIRVIKDNSMGEIFPKERAQELNSRLVTVLSQLNQPPKSEVIHHHHFPAIAWTAAGLFLALCLVSTGWFTTLREIDEYKAGDFKYRHLKLSVDSAASAYLFRMDNLYEGNPDSFQNTVLNQERLKQRRLELLDQIRSVDDQIGGIQDTAGEKKKSKK
jgi:hypothetical protein